eukprot:scaffold72819_cov62-Cyclotella_meneghiniana.AAC.2
MVGIASFTTRQGTGSPVTSGATKAPITPSPTGPNTPGPTAVGGLTYSLLGAGICQDSSGNYFDYIAGDVTAPATAADCSKFCGGFASSDLLGFQIYKVGGAGTLNCFCLFPDGQIPSPTSGSYWFQVRSDYTGSGHITQAPNTVPNYECYVYPKGTASPVASPV